MMIATRGVDGMMVGAIEDPAVLRYVGGPWPTILLSIVRS